MRFEIGQELILSYHSIAEKHLKRISDHKNLTATDKEQ